MPYEYRVLIAFRQQHGREVIIKRPENPFKNLQQAEAFAAKFTPPKFTRAWVERRCVGEWEPLDKPEP